METDRRISITVVTFSFSFHFFRRENSNFCFKQIVEMWFESVHMKQIITWMFCMKAFVENVKYRNSPYPFRQRFYFILFFNLQVFTLILGWWLGHRHGYWPLAEFSGSNNNGNEAQRKEFITAVKNENTESSSCYCLRTKLLIFYMYICSFAADIVCSEGKFAIPVGSKC